MYNKQQSTSDLATAALVHDMSFHKTAPTTLSLVRLGRQVTLHTSRIFYAKGTRGLLQRRLYLLRTLRSVLVLAGGPGVASGRSGTDARVGAGSSGSVRTGVFLGGRLLLRGAIWGFALDDVHVRFHGSRCAVMLT